MAQLSLAPSGIESQEHGKVYIKQCQESRSRLTSVLSLRMAQLSLAPSGIESQEHGKVYIKQCQESTEKKKAYFISHVRIQLAT